jgi:hypothetical protein
MREEIQINKNYPNAPQTSTDQQRMYARGGNSKLPWAVLGIVVILIAGTSSSGPSILPQVIHCERLLKDQPLPYRKLSAFIKLLEEKGNAVEWWYKNGDSGTPATRAHAGISSQVRPSAPRHISHPRDTETKNLSPRGLRTRSLPKKTYTSRDTRMRMRVRMPKKADDFIPDAADNIRVIPLGGCEEIGKNMIVVEYRDDIIVIDMGFKFKEEDTPGVDYILPNTKYLEDRQDKIRAVIITHGHLDHIGGIPYIIGRIGNPPIYTRGLTSVMIRKRQEEFPNLPALDIRVVEKEDAITIGKLKVKFFSVTHTIPNAFIFLRS